MTDVVSSTSGAQERFGLNLPEDLGSQRFLMTGDEFLESLRDGRSIVGPDGAPIEDVTTHPTTSAGVRTLARYYDMQHDPKFADLMTYDSPEVGGRASLAWKVPRNAEDLRQRLRLLELSTRLTLGTFGRPPDYGQLPPTSLLQIIDRLAAHSEQRAKNLRSFLIDGVRHNLMSTDLVADVQSDRNIATSQKPGRLRCIKQDDDGLVLFGAKPCSSIAIQGHLGTILTLLSPGADLDSAIFAIVPVNAPGVTFVSRESTLREGTAVDRPVSRMIGDEVDSLMIFQDVFIPSTNVFSLGDEDILGTYFERGALPHWHILARLAFRAEILAGTADMVVSVLGTDKIPQVRDAIADIAAYAHALRAFVIAAQETGQLRNEVFVPNGDYVTPGRLYAIETYPRIIQILRELCGQGLISRFTDKQFADERIGGYLREFLPGTGVSAEDKNQLFNLVWELSCSEQAIRIGLFENLNATPPGALRAFIYSRDRKSWAEPVRELLHEARS